MFSENTTLVSRWPLKKYIYEFRLIELVFQSTPQAQAQKRTNLYTCGTQFQSCAPKAEQSIPKAHLPYVLIGSSHNHSCTSCSVYWPRLQDPIAFVRLFILTVLSNDLHMMQAFQVESYEILMIKQYYVLVMEMNCFKSARKISC